MPEAKSGTVSWATLLLRSALRAQRVLSDPDKATRPGGQNYRP